MCLTALPRAAWRIMAVIFWSYFYLLDISWLWRRSSREAIECTVEWGACMNAKDWVGQPERQTGRLLLLAPWKEACMNFRDGNQQYISLLVKRFMFLKRFIHKIHFIIFYVIAVTPELPLSLSIDPNLSNNWIKQNCVVHWKEPENPLKNEPKIITIIQLSWLHFRISPPTTSLIAPPRGQEGGQVQMATVLWTIILVTKRIKLNFFFRNYAQDGEVVSGKPWWRSVLTPVLLLWGKYIDNTPSLANDAYFWKDYMNTRVRRQAHKNSEKQD